MKTGRRTPDKVHGRFVFCLISLFVSLILASCTGSQLRGSATPTGTVPMVSFVFDDGNDTDYLVGRDLFAAHGTVASSAITTGFLNTADHLTSFQAVALQDAGWEIMGHTVSHPNLKSLPPAEIEEEISRSKTDLQKIGLSVNNIVYPYNKNDETVRSVVARYYRSGRGGTNAFNYPDLDPFFIRSFSLKHDLPAMKGLIDKAHTDKSWLVFYHHEINAKVRVSDYDGTFLKGEKLRLSPSGTVARHVTTHWFPLYGYAVYLVPFFGVPLPGDTIRGETSGATARIDDIAYNEREQLSEMLGYLRKNYPDMPVVTIDRGLDILGIPKLTGGLYGKR